MINFWSKHKGGILVTLIFHFALILYFNITEIQLPIRKERAVVLLELDYTLDEVTEEEIKEEEIIEEQPTEEDINKKIQNLMRDAQDRRTKSTQNYSEKSVEQELAEKYKKLEEDIIKKRQEDGKGFDPSKYEINKSTNSDPVNNNPNEAKNQAAGRVTTACNIPGRNCYAKTPSYRCPAGGKIHIDIKVNQKGKVIAAAVNTIKSTSSNSCLINEAIKYAKRSKANQDFKAPNSQSGYIIYNFISQ
jgi:hypothetical protein